MNALLEVGLSNAVAAVALVLVALVGSRLCRSARLAHALWLLVFVKLLTPPLFAVSVTWDDGATVAEPVTADSSSAPTAVLAADVTPAPLDRASLAAQLRTLEDMPLAVDSWTGPKIAEVLAWLWLAGSLWWFGSTAVLLLRFRRCLCHAIPVPAALQVRVGALAARLSLRRVPELLLVPGHISPMVWSLGCRPRLLFPADLLHGLEPDQADTLLLHELAHIARRDHWTRWLELIVSGLYWWLPVVWLARRGLHAAEEECCDGRVLSALPDAGPDYAQALVATLTFLSPDCRLVPAVATGIGTVPQIKRRLTMILRARSVSFASRTVGAALFVLAALALVWTPALAQPSAEKTPTPQEVRRQQIEALRQLLRSLEEDQVKDLAARERAALERAAQANYARALEAAQRALMQAQEKELEQRKVAEGLLEAARQTAKALTEEKKLKSPPLHPMVEQQLRTAVQQAAAELERAKAQVSVAEAQLKAAERQLKYLEAGETQRGLFGKGNSTPKIEGKVTKVSATEKSLVAISIGSDDGLKENMTLEVYRLSPNPEYVGKVRLVIVKENSAVGRMTTTNGQVKPGDRVAASIAPADPAKKDTKAAPEAGKLPKLEAMAFSPDGRVLAAATDNVVRLWDAQTGKVLSQSLGSVPTIGTIKFSPDGKLAATAGLGTKITLLAIPTGEVVRTLQLPARPAGYLVPDVVEVRFAPDGKTLTAVTNDHYQYTFDVATGKQVTFEKAK